MPVNTGPDSNTYTIPEVQLGDTFNYWKDTTNIMVYKLNKLRIYDAVDGESIGVTYGATGAWKALLQPTITSGHTFTSLLRLSGGLTTTYVFASSGVTVGGNFSVSGGTTLASTLDVGGVARFGAGVTVSSNLNVGGFAVLGGGLTAGGNLFVAGGGTLTAQLDAGSIAVVRGVTIGGNLTVVGGTTLSGRLDLGSVFVSAGATIGGNLTVVGGTTLSGRLDLGSIATQYGATVGTNLTVSGGTTLSGRLDATSVVVSTGVTVGGNMTVTGNVAVTGGSTFSSRMNANSISVANGLTVSGNLTVTSGTTLSGRLDANTISVISSNNSGLLDPGFNSYTDTAARSNMLIRANAGNTTLFFGNSGTSAGWIQVQTSDSGTKQRSLSLNPVGGNVGIGITGPTVALDVNGAIKASDFASGNILPKVYAYNDATYPIETGSDFAVAGNVPSLAVGQSFLFKYTLNLGTVYIGKPGQTWICFCKFGNTQGTAAQAFVMLVITGSTLVRAFPDTAGFNVAENVSISGWRIA